MTSGEYAYDLLRHLQRHFRCYNPGDRAYLYNFFGELVGDQSVNITKEAHDAFIEQLNVDGEYYAKKGLTALDEIYNDENFENSYTVLQKSFLTIGIGMEFQKKDMFGYPNGIDFILPNGTTKSISRGAFENAYLCVRSGNEYSYAKKMMPYYTFEKEEIKDLSQIDTNIAGYGTTWTFDESKGEFEISGAGSFAGGKLLSNLGLNNSIKTVILGAGVNRLQMLSLQISIKTLTIVSFRGEKEPMIFDNNFIGKSTLSSGETPYYEYTIYTDNEDFKNAPFGENQNYKINLKPLSEWEG